MEFLGEKEQKIRTVEILVTLVLFKQDASFIYVKFLDFKLYNQIRQLTKYNTTQTKMRHFDTNKLLNYAPKTYQHEYYKKKSNYLRDVTHLVRDKERIDICKCCCSL